MEFKSFDPCPDLEEYIESYYFCSTREVNYDTWFRAIPNGNQELFFNLHGSKFEIRSERYSLQNAGAFFVGLHGVYSESYIRNYSPMNSFIVSFKPMGLQKMTGFCEADLTNRIVKAELIFGDEVAKVWNELDEMSDPEEKKKCVERFMLQKVNPVRNRFDEIDGVVGYIKRRNGLTTIKEICSSMCVQRRTIERLFRKHLGLSPGEYSRIFRLNYVFLEAMENRCLSNLAIACGYYDQAHFTNDFKKMTGITPEAFLERIEPFFFSKILTNRIYIPYGEPGDPFGKKSSV
jgi:AraC-like DNA-binding protein